VQNSAALNRWTRLYERRNDHFQKISWSSHKTIPFKCRNRPGDFVTDRWWGTAVHGWTWSRHW